MSVITIKNIINIYFNLYYYTNWVKEVRSKSKRFKNRGNLKETPRYFFYNIGSELEASNNHPSVNKKVTRLFSLILVSVQLLQSNFTLFILPLEAFNKGTNVSVGLLYFRATTCTVRI